MKNYFLLLFSLIGFSVSTFGINSYVTNTNDSGTGSLRDQLSVATSGDTIFIDVAGTLNLTSSSLTVSGDIHIIGPGASHFTINQTISGLSAFSLGSSSVLSIEGVAFKGSTGTQAVLYAGPSASLTVKYCLFENNSRNCISANMNTTVTVESCSFISNSSAYNGVCINIVGSGAIASVSNCTFYDNQMTSSNSGCGVFCSQSTVTLTNNTFVNNVVLTNASNIYINSGGVVNSRNNIFYNETGSGTTGITISGGALNSLGGNIGNELNGVTDGFTDATDNFSSVLDPQLSTALIEDGWGLKYLTYVDDTSPGIDIDPNPSGLPLYDQRRVWRVMDGGTFSESADAGAVEYSQLTVKSAGGATESFDDLYQTVYNTAGIGKKAFVFEISGGGPFICPVGFMTWNLFEDSTIVNGFSQNGSRIPGPGTSASNVTSAITPIVINNSQGVATGLDLSGDYITVAGVSIIDFGLGGTAIKSSGLAAEISGNHIGVGQNGLNNTSNMYGVVVEQAGTSKIGSGKYCGYLYHSNRNVISGNINAQIVINSGDISLISHNFIGLASDGISAPIGIPSAADTGIVLRQLSGADASTIGGNDTTDFNVIGGQDYGICIVSTGNLVLNNIIGGTLTGEAISANTYNSYGITITGVDGTDNSLGVWAGDGNTIIGNGVGVQILDGATYNGLFHNHIGVSKSGSLPLGNSNEGVLLSGSGTMFNEIGLANSMANVISNNFTGVKVTTDASNNSIKGNIIGFSGDGNETPMGNIGNGIEVEGWNTYDNVIGEAGAGNLIGNNGGEGILLTNASTHTLVQSNLIGFQSDTILAAGNSNNGIFVYDMSSYNLIGGCGVDEGNYIGFNGLDGILFEGAFADNDSIYGNKIGLDANFNAAGNAGAGLAVVGSAGYLNIGNTAIGCANEIAYNSEGISLGTEATNISISGNSIHDNTNLGIDIDADGAPDYTTGDGLMGNESTPIGSVIECVSCGGNTTFTITPESSANVTYEVFKADGDSQEGDSLVYVWTGNVTYLQDTTITMPINLPVNMVLVMTARISNSTSEFGPSFTVAAPPVALAPTISANSICTMQATSPTLTVSGETGTAVWFSDAGLLNRIGLGTSITPPLADLSTPGLYDYYAVDSVAGCYGAVGAPVTLTVISSPIRPITGATSVCLGVSSEVYSVSPVTSGTYSWDFATESGGYSNNNYIYNPGSTTNTLTADFTPSYSGSSNDTLIVTVDSLGCISSDTTIIDVVEAPILELPSGYDPTTCGGSDGLIILLPGTGTFDFYYNSGTLITIADNGFGEAHMTNLSSGVYSFDSVSNAAGCFTYVADTIELFDPVPPSISSVYTIDPTTCGGSDGAVIIHLGAGSNVGPYTVDLDGGTTVLNSISMDGDSLIISGLFDGQILNNPAVTDEVTACSDSYLFSGTLLDPAPPIATAGSDTTICAGGSAMLEGGPDSGGYTYSWDNGGGTGTTPTLMPTVTTTYTFTVTDFTTLCAGSDQVTVTVNPLPVITFSSPNEVCDGSVHTYDATVSGASPFNYNWQSPSDFSNNTVEDPTTLVLGAGAYTHKLIVTDADGCIDSNNVVLTVNELPNEGNTSITDVTCLGGFDGSIMIAPLGSYAHSWVGPNGFFETTENISGLESGTYTNTMTDNANGCIGLYTIVVNQPLSLPSFNAIGTDPTCNGDTDGSITINSTSGVSPIQYSVDNGVTFQASNTFLGLSASSNTVIIQDANNCVSLDSVINLVDPLAITVTTIIKEDTCSNSVGEIEVFAAGGSTGGPYSYSIDAGVSYTTSSVFSNLTVGNYDVIALDGNGCLSSIVTSTVVGLTGVEISLTSNSANVCNGFVDGVADIMIDQDPFGGVTFVWSESYSPFATTEDVANLGAGSYSVVVTDNGGCVDSLDFDIVELPLLTATLSQVDISCFGLSDGEVEISSPSGGTGTGYTYTWEVNDGLGTIISTSSSVTNLVYDANGYLGTVYDSYGCSFGGTLLLGQGETFSPVIIVASQIDSCANNNSFDFIDNNGTPASGAAGYSWSFANGVPAASAVQNPTGVSFGMAGQHSVTYEVTSNDGCVFTDAMTVNVVAEPATYAGIDQTICSGLSTGLTGTPNGGGYTYSWILGGTTTQIGTTANITVTPDPINGSFYLLYVTETLTGCVRTDSVSVLVSSTPNPSIDQTGPLVFCENESYGNLSVTSSNATAGTFTWYVGTTGSAASNGATFALDNANVGSQFIYVTESIGACVSDADTIFIDFTGNDLEVNEGSVFCLGETVELVSNGSGDIGWVSANGEIDDTTNSITFATPTSQNSTYYVEMDLNGCIFMDSVLNTLDVDCGNSEITVNAFSPDGDGINDQFILDIPLLLKYENNLIIFNRWGDEIGSFQNYNNADVSWDGRNKAGDYVTDGTYFYIIEIPEINLKESGWIQVVR